MKMFIILVGMLIAAGAMAQFVPQENIQLAAVSGCCKERTQNGWRIISRQYSRCQDLNSRFDSRDDINVEQGRFWWDSQCE